MNNREKEVLSDGLKAGFAGGSERKQVNLGDKTRLLEDCEQVDGEWSYEYKLLDQEDSIPVFVGKETIKHGEELVFVHNFLLCPIE